MAHTLSNFHFNPFAGISHDDIDEVIIPRPEVREIIAKIEKGEELLVEFLGKKGRGKTTHLLWLQSKFPQYPIYLLNNGADKQALLDDPSNVLFVDSIHHLSLGARIKLFSQKKALIFTTHWPRKWEATLAGKYLQTVRFKGISTKILTEIVNKRIQFAAKQDLSSQDSLSQEEIKGWIHKYGDNYRGILNELYSNYQEHEHTF